MAHDDAKKWIVFNLEDVEKTLIEGCGDQMGIPKGMTGKNCLRSDEILFRSEQTIRYEVPEKNRFGDDKSKHFILDGVFYVRPGQWGLNSVPSKLRTFTVGIEIKDDKNDLMNDTKCLFYLGWTDFFFFMVPASLREDAKRHITELNDARIGLMSYRKDGFMATIDIVPIRQDVLPINKYALALQALFAKSKGMAEAVVKWEEDEHADGHVAPDAYLNACLNLHPEYGGREDTYKVLLEQELVDDGGYRTDIERSLQKSREIQAESMEARKATTARKKAAKETRAKFLQEQIREVRNEEVRHRLVAQTNDTQSVYHAIRKAVGAESGAAKLTADSLSEAVGVSKSTVETSLRHLRNVGLIHSEGTKKHPEIRLVEDVKPSGNGYTSCLLYRSMTTKKQKQKVSMVCSECSNKECPMHGKFSLDQK